uniref:Uncharacterized protein n=1 Tax=Anguilla anguilla TaxID=7936 RepID=A0A0E9PGV5_ANGAN
MHFGKRVFSSVAAAPEKSS